MSLVRTNAVGHGDFAGDETKTALGKAADEDQATRETVTQQRQDAERPAPAAPPAPPESNHPPPPAPQTTAATATNKPDESRPTSTPRVGREALAFHAAVAAGDVPSVEAYIARNADKVVRPKPTGDGLYRQEDTAGFAALLVVAGPTRDLDGSDVSPLEVVDLRGRTPLHTACVEGRAEVVRVLLRAGADASAFDSAGFSPLHRCAQSSDVHSARAILDRRRTAAAAAGGGGGGAAASADPVVDALTRRGDYRPIHLACHEGSADMVGLLARRGADLSAGDKWGASPLHRACLEGHLAAARSVLDAGAEVDPRDIWKSTPLHRACQSGHAGIVELLLRRGASTSARDDIMHRPGQSFDEDVSSEQRQVVANLLERSEQERKTVVASYSPPARSPSSTSAAWARTRSANASSTEGLQRSQSRYVPPAARAAAAAAAAAATAAAAADPAADSNRPCLPGTTGTSSGGGGGGSGSSSNAGVQPWRRKTSTWSGLPGDGGPDAGSDGPERGARGGAAAVVGDGFFAAGRTGDESTGMHGAGFGDFGDFLRGEEKRRVGEEEEEEESDDEEMFELEMSAVVEAVDGRLWTGPKTRA